MLVTHREVFIEGLNEDGKAVVSSGIQASEIVVKAGVNSLSENDKVVVLQDAAATNVGAIM